MTSLFNLPLSVALIAVVVGLLYCRHRLYWILGLGFTVSMAITAGILALPSLIPLGLLLVMLYRYQSSNPALHKIRGLFLAFSIVIGVLLGLHILPGFNNIQYIEEIRLSEAAASFDVWFNFDKALFGILVLGIVLRSELNQNADDWWRMSLTAMPIIVLGLLATFVLGLLLGYSHVELSLHSVFWSWAFKNLFFTVIAEEALFRGLIQRHLNNYLSGLQSVSIAALLFGVAHFAGGWQYVLLSSFAGFMYGYAYLKTGRIEAAILAHFLLNVTHFIFFVYPYAI